MNTTNAYLHPNFLKFINRSEINIIFEVGARYGDESLSLSNYYDSSTVYSFECNPLTIDACEKKLSSNNKIKFFNFGLGEADDIKPFFSYILNNDGSSSFFKRIDSDQTQKHTGDIQMKRIDNFVKENSVAKIDLLCMDTQGYELNILKGAGNFIKNIKHIILEEPNPSIDEKWLPKEFHSKYLGAPPQNSIEEYLLNNGFSKKALVKENELENNVLYSLNS